MPLESGSRLGPYEILACIGAGSMGEVYRARGQRIRTEDGERLVEGRTLSAVYDIQCANEKRHLVLAPLGVLNIPGVTRVRFALGLDLSHAGPA